MPTNGHLVGAIFAHRAALKLAAFLCVASLGLGACSSAPETKADDAKAKKRISTPYQAQKPSPEELAKSPCGNPDWAQLPEGAQKSPKPGDSTDDDSGSESTPSKSDAPTTDDEHSSAQSDFSAIKPCT